MTRLSLTLRLRLWEDVREALGKLQHQGRLDLAHTVAKNLMDRAVHCVESQGAWLRVVAAAHPFLVQDARMCELGSEWSDWLASLSLRISVGFRAFRV